MAVKTAHSTTPALPLDSAMSRQPPPLVMPTTSTSSSSSPSQRTSASSSSPAPSSSSTNSRLRQLRRRTSPAAAVAASASTAAGGPHRGNPAASASHLPQLSRRSKDRAPLATSPPSNDPPRAPGGIGGGGASKSRGTPGATTTTNGAPYPLPRRTSTSRRSSNPRRASNPAPTSSSKQEPSSSSPPEGAPPDVPSSPALHIEIDDGPSAQSQRVRAISTASSYDDTDDDSDADREDRFDRHHHSSHHHHHLPAFHHHHHSKLYHHHNHGHSGTAAAAGAGGAFDELDRRRFGIGSGVGSGGAESPRSMTVASNEPSIAPPSVAPPTPPPDNPTPPIPAFPDPFSTPSISESSRHHPPASSAATSSHYHHSSQRSPPSSVAVPTHSHAHQHGHHLASHSPSPYSHSNAPDEVLKAHHRGSLLYADHMPLRMHTQSDAIPHSHALQHAAQAQKFAKGAPKSAPSPTPVILSNHLLFQDAYDRSGAENLGRQSKRPASAAGLPHGGSPQGGQQHPGGAQQTGSGVEGPSSSFSSRQSSKQGEQLLHPMLRSQSRPPSYGSPFVPGNFMSEHPSRVTSFLRRAGSQRSQRPPPSSSSSAAAAARSSPSASSHVASSSAGSMPNAVTRSVSALALPPRRPASPLQQQQQQQPKSPPAAPTDEKAKRQLYLEMLSSVESGAMQPRGNQHFAHHAHFSSRAYARSAAQIKQQRTGGGVGVNDDAVARPNNNATPPPIVKGAQNLPLVGSLADAPPLDANDGVVISINNMFANNMHVPPPHLPWDSLRFPGFSADEADEKDNSGSSGSASGKLSDKDKRDKAKRGSRAGGARGSTSFGGLPKPKPQHKRVPSIPTSSSGLLDAHELTFEFQRNHYEALKYEAVAMTNLVGKAEAENERLESFLDEITVSTRPRSESVEQRAERRFHDLREIINKGTADPSDLENGGTLDFIRSLCDDNRALRNQITCLASAVHSMDFMVRHIDQAISEEMDAQAKALAEVAVESGLHGDDETHRSGGALSSSSGHISPSPAEVEALVEYEEMLNQGRCLTLKDPWNRADYDFVDLLDDGWLRGALDFKDFRTMPSVLPPFLTSRGGAGSTAGGTLTTGAAGGHSNQTTMTMMSLLGGGDQSSSDNMFRFIVLKRYKHYRSFKKASKRMLLIDSSRRVVLISKNLNRMETADPQVSEEISSANAPRTKKIRRKDLRIDYYNTGDNPFATMSGLPVTLRQGSNGDLRGSGSFQPNSDSKAHSGGKAPKQRHFVACFETPEERERFDRLFQELIIGRSEDCCDDGERVEATPANYDDYHPTPLSITRHELRLSFLSGQFPTELIAAQLHRRVLYRRFREGWTYGKTFSVARQTCRSLVSFEDLDIQEKNGLEECVNHVLESLYSLGFVIVQRSFSDVHDPPHVLPEILVLLNFLAEDTHDFYVSHRLSRGYSNFGSQEMKTLEVNPANFDPSLRPYSKVGEYQTWYSENTVLTVINAIYALNYDIRLSMNHRGYITMDNQRNAFYASQHHHGSISMSYILEHAPSVSMSMSSFDQYMRGRSQSGAAASTLSRPRGAADSLSGGSGSTAAYPHRNSQFTFALPSPQHQAQQSPVSSAPARMWSPTAGASSLSRGRGVLASAQDVDFGMSGLGGDQGGIPDTVVEYPPITSSTVDAQEEEAAPKSGAKRKKQQQGSKSLVGSSSTGLSRAPPSLSAFMVQKPTTTSGSSPSTMAASPLAVALASASQSPFMSPSKFSPSGSSPLGRASFSQSSISAPPTLSRSQDADAAARPSSHTATPDRPHAIMRSASSEGNPGDPSPRQTYSSTRTPFRMRQQQQQHDPRGSAGSTGSGGDRSSARCLVPSSPRSDGKSSGKKRGLGKVAAFFRRKRSPSPPNDFPTLYLDESDALSKPPPSLDDFVVATSNSSKPPSSYMQQQQQQHTPSQATSAPRLSPPLVPSMNPPGGRAPLVSRGTASAISAPSGGGPLSFFSNAASSTNTVNEASSQDVAPSLSAIGASRGNGESFSYVPSHSTFALPLTHASAQAFAPGLSDASAGGGSLGAPRPVSGAHGQHAAAQNQHLQQQMMLHQQQRAMLSRGMLPQNSSAAASASGMQAQQQSPSNSSRNSAAHKQPALSSPLVNQAYRPLVSARGGSPTNAHQQSPASAAFGAQSGDHGSASSSSSKRGRGGVQARRNAPTTTAQQRLVSSRKSAYPRPRNSVSSSSPGGSAHVSPDALSHLQMSSYEQQMHLQQISHAAPRDQTYYASPRPVRPHTRGDYATTRELEHSLEPHKQAPHTAMMRAPPPLVYPSSTGSGTNGARGSGSGSGSRTVLAPTSSSAAAAAADQRSSRLSPRSLRAQVRRQSDQTQSST